MGVAVSGGADSVALLHLSLELQQRLGIVPCVIHLNHQLRGRAADADEKFVTKLAAQHGLECFVERVDVAARAKREKLNVEDAARRARYEFFAALVKEGKIARVATAHTADDQAETVLAHILRGAGLAGLSGIHAMSGDVVRPLLGIRRAALRVYLKEKKQTWCEDATNRDTTKLRARIRKKLMPLLEKQFQPATVEHLCRLAEFAREDDAYLNCTAEFRAAALSKTSGDGIRMNALELQCRPPRSATKPGDVDPLFKLQTSSLNRRMVRHIVKAVKPQAGEIGSKHVEAVLALAESGENGKSLQLPAGVEVRRERDELLFRAATRTRKNIKSAKLLTDSLKKEFEHSIDLERKDVTIAVPCLQRCFRFTMIDAMIDWPEKTGETTPNGSVLNRDALCKPLVLRNWRPGDTFQPLGHRKPHKLKRLLNEKRISRWERDGWPVLTSAGVIAWVRGFAAGTAFAPTVEMTSAVQIEECAISSQ